MRLSIMALWNNVPKYMGCFMLLVVGTGLYAIFLLQTYNTTVDSSQVDTSVDIFQHRQNIQQEKHKQLLREYTGHLDGLHQGLTLDNAIIHNPVSSHGQVQQNLDEHESSNGNTNIKEDGHDNRHSMIPNRRNISTSERVSSVHTNQSIHTPLSIRDGAKQMNSAKFPRPNQVINKPDFVTHDDMPISTYRMNYTENEDSGSGTYKAFWVKSQGPLLQRISNYNTAIHKFRQQLIKARAEMPHQELSNTLETLWCNRDSFHKELEKFPQVKTISLEWLQKFHNATLWDSGSDSENILLQDYPEWNGSDNLCTWIRTAGFTRARWDAVYNRTCRTLNNVTQLSIGKGLLEPVYLHGKPINKNHYWPHHGIRYPDYFYKTTPPQVFYMHIVEDAVVTKLGDVLSGNVKLVPYSCSQDVGSSPPPGYQMAPVYDDVFVLGQYWGDNFFHMMVENLPRVAPYVQFLNANPDVLIHAQAVTGYTAHSLHVLQLNATRLIKGTVKAKRVFLPQGTPCGFPHLPSIQVLSHLYQQHIRTHLPLPPRRSLLLIRRSGNRRFTQHLNIQDALQRVAMDFDLDFEVFIDNPSPPMETAMVMFYRAALVVGPHGAGLSNLVYCRPRTLVIEGVCNPPHVNMCYQWTSHVLGLRYHGIASRGGCENVVDIDYRQVETAARRLLRSSPAQTEHPNMP